MGALGGKGRKMVKLLILGTALAFSGGLWAASGKALTPKIHDVPGNVFSSAIRVEEAECSGGAVVLEGDRLYFGAGHTLYIFDATKPLSPELVGKVGGIGSIRQLAVWKGMVYVAARETGMWIVDARNAAVPVVLSRFDTVELATGISVVGNLVMLGQRQNGVEFIDVSDPHRPAHIRMEKTNESQSTIFRDGICYSGDWFAGEVTMIDAHDMKTVRTIRTVKLRGHGDGLDIQGNLLYVSTGHHYHDLSAKWFRPPKPGDPGFGAGHALEIIDIADPASPKVLGRCPFNVYYQIGMDMWMPRASGNYVFCADTYNGLYAVDAKDPAKMKIVGHITVPDPGDPTAPGTPVTSVAVGEGAVYLAVRKCGLVVAGCPVAKARKAVYPEEPDNLGFRQSYRQELRHFSSWMPQRRGQVKSAAPFGDYVYVACGQAGLSILKAKDGEYVEVSSFDIPFCGDVKIRGGKLYSAEALQGLAIYDLSNPDKPREVERVRDFGAAICCPQWVWVPKNSPLAIVSDRESGYRIMDPTDKWKLLLVNHGCPGWDRYFSDELVGGRYFAQSFANVGFSWIDVSAVPPKVTCSRVNTSGLNGGCLAWKNDRLLLVSKGRFVYLRPGQPENPDGSRWQGVPMHQTDTPGPSDGQPAWDGGNILAVTARIRKEIWKLDMTDETAPKTLWGEKTVGHPELSVFHAGRLLVPCGYQGLLIEK